jgi:hypothetical protein
MFRHFGKVQEIRGDGGQVVRGGLFASDRRHGGYKESVRRSECRIRRVEAAKIFKGFPAGVNRNEKIAKGRRKARLPFRAFGPVPAVRWRSLAAIS